MKKIKYLSLLGLLFIFSFGVITANSFAQESQATKPPSQKKEEKKKKKRISGVRNNKNRTDIPENLKNKNNIEWRLHKSITEVFETKFPQNYKYKIFPFQFNKNTFASSAEIVSSLDSNVGSKKEKSVLIKVTQTFGNELTYKEMKQTLERATRRYVLSANTIGGAVLTNKDIKHRGFFGKDIYISYDIGEEKYGLRIRLYITNFSKVEQVLSGPAHTMYSYRSDDFFDTLTLSDGIIKIKNDIPLGYGWKKYTSKNNVFTVTLPPHNKDYTPFPPKFKSKSKSDTMNFIVVDPVTEKRVRYNVYSYKTDSPLSYANVKAILFSKHVSKFVQNVSSESLNVKNLTINDVDAMKTKLVITPSERYPGINTIFLEAQYKDNILVVQEFLCGAKHAKSGLDKTFFSLLKFHPEKFGTKPPAPESSNKTKKPATSTSLKKKETPREEEIKLKKKTENTTSTP